MSPASSNRTLLFQELHRRFDRGCYDNWVVWAGNLSLQLDGLWFEATLARGYVGAEQPFVEASARVELFAAALADRHLGAEDVDARLWIDEARQRSAGIYSPMHLLTGTATAAGNFVFESAPFRLRETGVYSYHG